VIFLEIDLRDSLMQLHVHFNIRPVQYTILKTKQ